MALTSTRCTCPPHSLDSKALQLLQASTTYLRQENQQGRRGVPGEQRSVRMGSSYSNFFGWPKGIPAQLISLPTREWNGLSFSHAFEINYEHGNKAALPNSGESVGTSGMTSHFDATAPPTTISRLKHRRTMSTLDVKHNMFCITRQRLGSTGGSHQKLSSGERPGIK